jgi:hypothetical protein
LACNNRSCLKTLLAVRICFVFFAQFSIGLWKQSKYAHYFFSDVFGGWLLTTTARTSRSYWSEKWQHVPMICRRCDGGGAYCSLKIEKYNREDG